MNKKFSTLLCASLLFSSAFTAQAEDLSGALKGGDATEMSELGSTTPKGVYQLRTSDGKILTVNDKGEYKLVTSANLSDVKSSLWCVQITEAQDRGQQPIYDFVNKGQSAMLAINVPDGMKVGETTGALSVGESYGGWAFSSVYKESLERNQTLYTYQEADNVLILLAEGDGIKAKKIKANEAENYQDALKFTLFNAGTYVLSAAEINAYLKENKNVLKFNPDANADVNPFSTTAFVAKGINSDTDHNFVYVTDKAKENSYLKVDTAANGVGTQFLKFGWTDVKAKGSEDALTSGEIANQHKFLFTYRPSGDSLFIQVQEARYLPEKRTENDYWKDMTPIKYGTVYHAVTCEGTDSADSLFVKLQNFTVADRIATIGKKPINTHISFGVDGCFTSTDKTSVNDGVYVIKNAKGEVLAAPIHLNDNVAGEANNDVQWVKLDAQDPKHMPAYQWVVLKTMHSDKAIETSPVVITNREFPQFTATVQFTKNEKGELVGNASIDNKVLSAVTFDALEESLIKDAKLGYKYISDAELSVNKYKFNYLNPFTPDYWIANGDGKDSLLYVKKEASRYELVKGSTAAYGYKVTDEAKKWIKGLAQLERTNYVVKLANTDKYLREESVYGQKYAMGAIATPDTFFFKENNHDGAKHFYAILKSHYVANEAGFDYKYAANIENVATTHKVGIADDGKEAGLKVELLNEKRTSSFSVEPDNTPLYRRFNNELLGENVNDASDSLYFVESIRKEYLMDENNTNLQHSIVDYAGIWNKDKANGKLAFRVDTAWLKRGAGEIKPQYLISAFQDVIAGEKIIPCTEDGKHIKPDGTPTDNPYECVHAVHIKTPAFVYGKYLVNFSDSAATCEADVNPFIFNTKAVSNSSYTRVGFVPAVQYGDTLLVLTGKYASMTKEQLKNEGIESMIATYKKEYPSFINYLNGDNHKNVTWSFRYVNPEAAAVAYEDGKEGENNAFLIESNVYAAGEKYQTVKGNKDEAIAPEKAAAWLKMHNGCLVLTDVNATFDNAKTGGDGALVFNAFQKTEKEDMVTSNDEIATEGVSVVAGNGTVTVQGAAGKSVVITNILGKVVAETVLTSDNATIAVPAGIVAVAVEGEEAVKTIVK